MATYFKQLYCLLVKNAIFKYRCKRDTIVEVAILLFVVAYLAVLRKTYPQPTYNAILSSEQIIHNASEIPGG